MVRSQIGNLTFDPSFGHNLCFKHPNGLCKFILDIYILISFQWYKECFNPMSFEPCNLPLKIWKSIETPTPKVWAYLGVCGFIPSHSPTFPRAWNVTSKLHFWPAPLQALALIMSPRLGLRQYPFKNHCYLSLRDIRQKFVFTMFENVLNFFPYFQNGFPIAIWVKPYLGGTIKHHLPQNHRNCWFHFN